MYKSLLAHFHRSFWDISGKTPAVVTQVICDVNLSACFSDSGNFTVDMRCQTAGWRSPCGGQWLTMRWMCCRAGVWGCGSLLWCCVWAGSGSLTSAGPEPGLRSPPAWTSATDCEPSSASVLPDPISPGRPGTARSWWPSSRESPGPAAPWRRSRRSTRRPGPYNYCVRDRLRVSARVKSGEDDDKHSGMLRATIQISFSSARMKPSYEGSARCECDLIMWQDQDVHHILPRLKLVKYPPPQNRIKKPSICFICSFLNSTTHFISTIHILIHLLLRGPSQSVCSYFLHFLYVIHDPGFTVVLLNFVFAHPTSTKCSNVNQRKIEIGIWEAAFCQNADAIYRVRCLCFFDAEDN